MKIIDYTEKSIVLFGDETRDLIKELKELGGRYNPKLTNPETNSKFAGWLFSKKKKEQVEELLKSRADSSKLIIKKKESVVDADIVQQPSYDSKNLSFEFPDIPVMEEIPSFIMIVPQVGNKINLGEGNKFEIVETIKNKDGHTFEFIAKNNNEVLQFGMIGKEWKIIGSKKV